jgi:hypothetical protein
MGVGMAACGASSTEEAASSQAAIGGSETLISVQFSTAEPEGQTAVHLRGYVHYVEGQQAKIVLRNDSRSDFEVASQQVQGTESTVQAFDTTMTIDFGKMPRKHDCISVVNPWYQFHEGRATEFGAFAFGDTKVYRDGKECLADPTRLAIPASKAEILEAWDASNDFGTVRAVGVRGSAMFNGGPVTLTLRGGDLGREILATADVAPPPGASHGFYEFETTFRLDETVPPEGQCVAVAAGATDSGEIGAFTYPGFIDGRATSTARPAKIFASSQLCGQYAAHVGRD